MQQIEFDFDGPGQKAAAARKKRVGLFVTCLVDLFRPVVGFSAVKLLEEAGFDVEVPKAQSCCGHSSCHLDDQSTAKAEARHVIQTFDVYDYVVTLSPSCATVIRQDYPSLFAKEPIWCNRAVALSAKCFDLLEFLCEIAKPDKFRSSFQGSIAYHGLGQSENWDLASGKIQRLLEGLEGIDLKEVSNESSLSPKAVLSSGAGTMISDDLGQLMDWARLLKREGSAIEVRHIAEILAGMADGPAIGERAASLTSIRP
ncbi:MAG: (Fe-S)-binding protein [Cohaesibacter sp.]|nr:(Fe-S)-binding protein [Cohaesibacter sp.]